jgi:putative hydrolase of HD superfamily
MSRRPGDEAAAFLELFNAAGRLKNERRKGWVRKLGMEHPESVADHSYRTALVAMVYSDLHGLDTAKVLKMAVIHDLPEAIVGDSIPGERTKRQKSMLESAAMKKILGGMPARQRIEYWGIWLEFNIGRSEEARLVRQVDKLEMAMQAAEYGRAHKGLGTEEFIESARAAIEDEDLVALLGLVSRTD